MEELLVLVRLGMLRSWFWICSSIASPFELNTAPELFASDIRRSTSAWIAFSIARSCAWIWRLLICAFLRSFSCITFTVVPTACWINSSHARAGAGKVKAAEIVVPAVRAIRMFFNLLKRWARSLPCTHHHWSCYPKHPSIEWLFNLFSNLCIPRLVWWYWKPVRLNLRFFPGIRLKPSRCSGSMRSSVHWCFVFAHDHLARSSCSSGQRNPVLQSIVFHQNDVQTTMDQVTSSWCRAHSVEQECSLDLVKALALGLRHDPPPSFASHHHWISPAIDWWSDPWWTDIGSICVP